MSRALVIGKSSETTHSIVEALKANSCDALQVDGAAGAIRRLRHESFDVVITDPNTTIEEDLALLDELRDVRPGVKAIVLAPSVTSADVIAALRARVFVCLSAPFDADQIAHYAGTAAGDSDWRIDIEVLSAQPQWVSLRANCRMLTAERVVTFFGELHSEVPQGERDELLLAFREILLNAMEHGAAFSQHKVVEVSAVRTQRTLVFYVRDPGSGFRREGLSHAAIANAPETPTAHIERREQLGMRPGGYGILLAQGVVDELIYSEVGNEVLLIKHTN